jgi:putative RNA 2'-phosphotransferase
MARQYVHLSTDVETASSVGRRKSRTPVLLAVDARGAAEAGIRFYRGNDRVWLTDGVPARFVTPVL